MRDFLSKRVVSLEHGESEKKEFTHWSEAEPFIHRMQG